MRNEPLGSKILSGLTVKSLLTEYPNSFQVLDWEGHFISVTDRFARFLEFEPKDLVGQSILKFTQEDDKENTENTFNSLGENPNIVNFENRLVTKSKEEVWIIWLLIPLRESKIILGFDRDVTIQKDISFEFLLQQQKYKSIFDNLPMGIAITDEKGKIH